LGWDWTAGKDAVATDTIVSSKELGQIE
jgi:hypothetical protein